MRDFECYAGSAFMNVLAMTIATVCWDCKPVCYAVAVNTV